MAEWFTASASDNCNRSNLSTFFTCFYSFTQQIQQCAWISNNLLQLQLHLSLFFLLLLNGVFPQGVHSPCRQWGGAGAMKQMCLMLLLYDSNKRKRKRKMKALNFVPFQGYDVIVMNDGLAGMTCCTIL